MCVCLCGVCLCVSEFCAVRARARTGATALAIAGVAPIVLAALGLLGHSALYAVELIFPVAAYVVCAVTLCAEKCGCCAPARAGGTSAAAHARGRCAAGRCVCAIAGATRATS